MSEMSEHDSKGSVGSFVESAGDRWKKYSRVTEEWNVETRGMDPWEAQELVEIGIELVMSTEPFKKTLKGGGLSGKEKQFVMNKIRIIARQLTK